MAKPRIDFGRLTPEETADLLRDVMAECDLLQVVAAILDAFSDKDDRAEIVAQIEDSL
jgi:hypothetical protein